MYILGTNLKNRKGKIHLNSFAYFMTINHSNSSTILNVRVGFSSENLCTINKIIGGDW